MISFNIRLRVSPRSTYVSGDKRQPGGAGAALGAFPPLLLPQRGDVGAEKCACVGSCAASCRCSPSMEFLFLVLPAPSPTLNLSFASRTSAQTERSRCTLALRGSVLSPVLLDSLQDLCPGVCETQGARKSPRKIHLLNSCGFNLNTWLAPLLPSLLGACGVPRVLEQDRAVPTAGQGL